MTTKTPALPSEVEIVFSPVPGIQRTMKVHVPDEGALAVWSAVGGRFQQMGKEWKDQEALLADLEPDDPAVEAFEAQRRSQATRGLSRALTVVQSALVDEADRDWIEDMLLSQRFGLGDAMGVLTATVDALRAMRPKAAPTTGPAKKARRG